MFQSTPFARRETSFGSGVTDIVNVSIHSLRKKGDLGQHRIQDDIVVSIHSLRKKGDRSPGNVKGRRTVSIHSLRKKGDAYASIAETMGICFNPLPSQEGRPTML